MNSIVRHELKTGFKPFVFWTLGLAFLVMAGMYKFMEISAAGGADINALFAQFPRIILAMLGMANADIQTLAGYYAVIGTYVLIITAIFAIHLGANAVSREMIDKTYEFVFTKPCRRAYILGSKIGGGLIYLFLFCSLILIFSFAAVSAYDLGEISSTIFLYGLNAFLVGLVVFSLAAALSALFDRTELGMKISNGLFILVYILSVFFDLAETPGLIKPFTPLRYFEARDLINGQLDFGYLALALVLSLLFTVVAFVLFQRKDLKAV
jgi:ABC-2 type transport system permease protein